MADQPDPAVASRGAQLPAPTPRRRAVKTAAELADRLHPPTPGLVVLIYHRVGRRRPIEVDLPAALFTEQMAFLAAETTIVTTPRRLARPRRRPTWRRGSRRW